MRIHACATFTVYIIDKFILHIISNFILQCVVCFVLKVSRTELPDSVVAHLMDKLSNIEFRLSHGVSEKLQLGMNIYLP
jgi:hypothetical protein